MHVVGNCYTFNQIIDSQLINSNQELIFLPGEHNIVSGNQSTVLLVNGIRHLVFLGQNATKKPIITCTKTFYFQFTDVQYINFSNLIFANCSGYSGGYFGANHTFYFKHSGEIYFKAVIIQNSKKSVGIALTEIISRFAVNDSHFSTRGVGIGLETYTMRSYLEMNIYNTHFNGSCIAVEGTQKVTFELVSSTIEKCSCPKVMQFLYLTIDIILKNITARDNKGQNLIYVHESKYVQFSGLFHFHRNNGGIVISSSSSLFIENAQIEFINNTIPRDNGMPGVPMFIRDSTLFVRSSNVTFKNNHGQHTGGIWHKGHPFGS